MLLLEHPDDGGSVLTKEAMDAFWGLHALVGDIKVRLVR